MKVNHNMSAVVTNAQLLKTENSLAASMERLSSGFKINHAKDDPSGIAITNKMQAQIDGLSKASEGSSNGISVLQIADSALGEITNILQRMRELSVQAVTDTNQLDERSAIQEEIKSLAAEVDRISKDTEYNAKKLLNGSADTRVYADGVSRISISDQVITGTYELSITSAATQTSVLSRTQNGTIPEGTIEINGVVVEINAGEDADTVFKKLRECADIADVKLFVTDGTRAQYPDTNVYTEVDKAFAYGDRIAFVSNQYGYTSNVEITCDNPALEQFLGLGTAPTAGQDAEITTGLNSPFSSPTITTDGNRIHVSDKGGFEMDFLVEAGKTGKVALEVTDIGRITVQTGANAYQMVQVRIPEVSAQMLYLDEIDVRRVNGDKAIPILDEAIATVSSVRSGVGAYQNRLETIVESLDASNEDMTQAISRIGDTDMAKEMTEYTKYSVLQQAATSVLAQANDIPQTVLQLLQ